MSSLEERMTELEVRLSFLEEALESLSDTVARHERSLDGTHALLAALRSELHSLRSGLGGTPAEDPPPPHY